MTVRINSGGFYIGNIFVETNYHKMVVIKLTVKPIKLFG